MSCDGGGPASALHLVLEPSPDPVPGGPVPDPVAGPDAGPGTSGTMVLAAPGPAPKKAVRIWLAGTVIAGAKRIAAKSHRNRGAASLASDVWRDLYAKPPGSVAQHRAHVKAAAWFPEGYEDTWLIWVRRAWTAYHVTVARGLKVTGNGISALGDKGRRVAVLLLIAAIAVTIVVLT